MTIARAQPGFGVIAGELYIAGGLDSAASATDALEVYDPTADSWAKKAPMPTARGSVASAVVNGRLYVAGGYTPGDLCCYGVLESYDPVTDQWSVRAPMPIPQGGAAAASIDGKLYVVGGISASAPNNPRNGTLQVYDPALDSWVAKTSMPTPRSSAAAVEMNGKLYVLGGTPTNTSVTAAVEVYDPNTDTWTSTTSMPTARAGLLAVVLNGLLYAIGGDGDGYLATNEVYDPSTDTWTTDAPMPTARTQIAGAAIDEAIFIVGGATPGYLIQSVSEAFTPESIPRFAFTGFFQPVDNPPAVNSVKAGSAIPVKFSLNGDQGLEILATGYPKSEPVECDTTAPLTGIEETLTAGGSALSYDPATDRYIYVWKTEKAWANSCRQLLLRLADGSIEKAYFSFPK